ncbi:MAG: hypothetical protein EOO15_24540, partial [Chitinophagaceae bacterium]
MHRTTAKAFFRTAALLFLISACKKSSTEPEQVLPDGTYVATGTVVLEPVRMYTAAGVTTDTSLTGPFVRRYGMPPGDPSTGYQLAITSMPVSSFPSITISGNSATLVNGTAALTVDVLWKNAAGMLLARRDTQTYLGYGIYPSRCEMLIKRAPLERPDSIRFEYATTGNSSAYGWRYRSQLAVDIQGNGLSVPLQSLTIRGSNNCWNSIFGIWAHFDPSVQTLLGPVDTIIQQTRHIP